MKQDTRRVIMQTARELFNQRGYNAVSTRDIADAMHISKGNLTYYFRKKEDLIEAIVQNMFIEHVTEAKTVPNSLETLDAMFLHVQNVAEENAFYFWHYTQLSQLSPGIRAMQSAKVERQHQVLAEAFANLHQKGLLAGEAYPGQYRQLIQAILLSCIYWTPHSKLDAEFATPGACRRCLWGLVYPLLTAKGRHIYDRKFQTAST